MKIGIDGLPIGENPEKRAMRQAAKIADYWHSKGFPNVFAKALCCDDGKWRVISNVSRLTK